jgi:hypothetical protein
MILLVGTQGSGKVNSALLAEEGSAANRGPCRPVQARNTLIGAGHLLPVPADGNLLRTTQSIMGGTLRSFSRLIITVVTFGCPIQGGGDCRRKATISRCVGPRDLWHEILRELFL